MPVFRSLPRPPPGWQLHPAKVQFDPFLKTTTSAFSVQRSTFGGTTLAFGVWRLAGGKAQRPKSSVLSLLFQKNKETNAKRKTPNAKRQTPNAKRQTPNAKRQTPNAG